jgi:two-component system response regulator AtoC
MQRILVVDDEESMLYMLKSLLVAEGYDVVTTVGGKAGQNLIRTEEFDLMVCDIRMHPVNGMEFLAQAHRERPDMAVVMLTAYGDMETAIKAKDLGAFDYVSKPFKADEFLMTIRRAIEYKTVLKNLREI